MGRKLIVPPPPAVDKAADTAEIRKDIRSLLEQARYKSDNTADANAFAALASAVDRFLSGKDSESAGARTLKEELFRISRDRRKEKADSRQTAYREEASGGRLFTEDGKAVFPGTCLGRGGQGAVYRAANMPGKAAKMFYRLSDREYMERRIRALIAMHVPARLASVPVCALPEKILYDDKAEFAGYLMPLVNTGSRLFNVWRDDPERKKYFPQLDYKGLVGIAYNLAEVFDHLNGYGIVIGDVNPSNVLVNYDGTVCFVDTDSFDFTDREGKEHFPCPVGMPEFLAPELQEAASLKHAEFTKESDAFSLAILIFRLLMDNRDPFGAAVSGQMSEPYLRGETAIKNGECLYFRKVPEKELPPGAPSMDLLPEYIRELFARVFDYTQETASQKISGRPSASEWMGALLRFYNEPMNRCEENPFHMYRIGLKACPFCSNVKIRKRKADGPSGAPVLTVGI